MRRLVVTVEFTEADLCCGERWKIIERVDAKMTAARRQVMTEVLAHVMQMSGADNPHDVAQWVMAHEPYDRMRLRR